MESSRRVFPLAALLFVIGAAGLSHFFAGDRQVDAVGTSGAGFALGVGFTLLLLAARGRLAA